MYKPLTLLVMSNKPMDDFRYVTENDLKGYFEPDREITIINGDKVGPIVGDLFGSADRTLGTDEKPYYKYSMRKLLDNSHRLFLEIVSMLPQPFDYKEFSRIKYEFDTTYFAFWLDKDVSGFKKGSVITVPLANYFMQYLEKGSEKDYDLYFYQVIKIGN